VISANSDFAPAPKDDEADDDDDDALPWEEFPSFSPAAAAEVLKVLAVDRTFSLFSASAAAGATAAGATAAGATAAGAIAEGTGAAPATDVPPLDFSPTFAVNCARKPSFGRPPPIPMAPAPKGPQMVLRLGERLWGFSSCCYQDDKQNNV
jgi:hypothetical protein